MEISPVVPADRQLVQAYGPEWFKISGVVHRSAVLVFPDRTEAWAASHPDELSAESFEPLRAVADQVDILIVGLGPQFLMFPPALRQTLRDWGIVVEAMATPAACRTYNVLLAEDRKVAAALLPMPPA
jgi:uncharacterized protein